MLASPFGSTVDLLHAMLDSDEVKSGRLAWRSTESFDCSSLDVVAVVAKISRILRSEFDDDMTETVKTWLQNHLNSMAVVGTLTWGMNAQWICKGREMKFDETFLIL